MANNTNRDSLAEDMKQAGQKLRDKANEAKGRVKQGVEDMREDMRDDR